MRVGIYAPDLAPEEGGGHTYQGDIVDALGALRGSTAHELVAIGRPALPPTGWDEAHYLSLDLDVGRRVVKRLGRTLQAVRQGKGTQPRWRSDELFETSRLDLLWSITAGTPTRELPYVTTVLDLQHRRQPVFPEVYADGEWDKRERFFARELGAATVVVVGNATGQAEVEQFYGVPAERIRRLPHPTPGFALNEPADNDALRRYRLEPGYVFYPAQFWPHKNHVGLLQALAILRDEHQLVLQAVFAGSDKGNRRHVEWVTRSLGLEAQVRILGFVPRADLITLYRQAFALAYVTYFGPENLPPLEAFALGCPVIASDVPGSEEQLGDAALLAPPSSPRDIASALLALHGDPELRSGLVSRGRDRARAQTPETYAFAVLAVLDELQPVIATWRPA
jgi:glycosyltransferase involved in cell wall biosynthesis